MVGYKAVSILQVSKTNIDIELHFENGAFSVNVLY
jgi:hypothetical protein|tara:strand:- start:1175 stop:1279 length:105 start_codon:yes stop_codon:yes gene_type:complete